MQIRRAVGGRRPPVVSFLQSISRINRPDTGVAMQAASMLIEEIEAPADKKPSLQHLAFKGSMTERESG